MFVLEHLWIIPLLPLLGSAANGFFGWSWPRRLINLVALGTTGLAALATAELAREFARLDAAQIPWTRSYFTWILAGNFRADYSLQVDSLTLVMLGWLPAWAGLFICTRPATWPMTQATGDFSAT